MTNNNLPALRLVAPPALPASLPELLRLPARLDRIVNWEQARQLAITDLHLLGLSQISITQQFAVLQALEAIHGSRMLLQAYRLTAAEESYIAELVRGRLDYLKHLADHHAQAVLLTVDQAVRDLRQLSRRRGFWEQLTEG